MLESWNMKKHLGIIVIILLWCKVGNALDTSEAKNACKDIGFVQGTEKFADCTLKLLLKENKTVKPKKDPVELCMNLVLARFGNDWYEYAAESCVNAIPSTPECMQRLIDMEVKKKGAYRHTNGQMKYARKCSPKK